MKISAYVIAYNEEKKIVDCLQTLLWADEIILVDSGSTDQTAELAENLGAKVVQVPFNGFGDLRNQAIAHCSGDWIFSLDSDERCTNDVRDEILSVIKNPASQDIYLVPRRNFFLGRWIKHSGWYPNYRQPQLFRRGKMRYDLKAVHEGYISHSDKEIGEFTSAIWQIPFKNLEEIIYKANRYSSLGVEKLIEKEKRGSFAKAFFHGSWSFLKHYILKRGFLDGWAGFIIALGNFEGTFYRYAKLTEQQMAWQLPKSHKVLRIK